MLTIYVSKCTDVAINPETECVSEEEYQLYINDYSLSTIFVYKYFDPNEFDVNPIKDATLPVF